MIKFSRRIFLASLIAFLTMKGVAAQDVQDIQTLSESIIEKYGLAAIAISTYQFDEAGHMISQKGAAGLRKANSSETVSLNDKWHIGYCTKAMTALLYTDIAKEKGLLLDTSVAEIFKDSVEIIDSAWESVTINDLLSHRAGIKDLGAGWMMGRIFDESPIQDQRLETAITLLSEPPKLPKGEFQYSNFGYILVGTAIEVMTGKDWEIAMREGLPGDLMGKEGWGFGPPQGAQPEGHRKALFRKKLKPMGQAATGADNSKALGPAGTVHATHDAWAQFGLAFLNASEALSDEQRTQLLTPPDGADYAAGWGLSETEENGTIYKHAGSNTMWLSQIVIIPDKQAVVLVSTNTPPKLANAAVRKATREAIKLLD